MGSPDQQKSWPVPLIQVCAYSGSHADEMTIPIDVPVDHYSPVIAEPVANGSYIQLEDLVIPCCWA